MHAAQREHGGMMRGQFLRPANQSSGLRQLSFIGRALRFRNETLQFRLPIPSVHSRNFAGVDTHKQLHDKLGTTHL